MAVAGDATLRILEGHTRGTNTAPITLIAGVALLLPPFPAGARSKTAPSMQPISPRPNTTSRRINDKSSPFYPARRLRRNPAGAHRQTAQARNLQLDGKLEIIILAPECIYDTLKGVANSPGHLQLRTGDGKILTEGDGFCGGQSEQLLTISNHVSTVIERAGQQ